MNNTRLSILAASVLVATAASPAATAFSRGCEAERWALQTAIQNYDSALYNFAATCPNGPLSDPYCAALYDEVLFAEFDVLMAQFDLEICENFIY